MQLAEAGVAGVEEVVEAGVAGAAAAGVVVAGVEAVAAEEEEWAVEYFNMLTLGRGGG